MIVMTSTVQCQCPPWSHAILGRQAGTYLATCLPECATCLRYLLGRKEATADASYATTAQQGCSVAVLVSRIEAVFDLFHFTLQHAGGCPFAAHYRLCQDEGATPRPPAAGRRQRCRRHGPQSAEPRAHTGAQFVAAAEG